MAAAVAILGTRFDAEQVIAVERSRDAIEREIGGDVDAIELAAGRAGQLLESGDLQVAILARRGRPPRPASRRICGTSSSRTSSVARESAAIARELVGLGAEAFEDQAFGDQDDRLRTLERAEALKTARMPLIESCVRRRISLTISAASCFDFALAPLELGRGNRAARIRAGSLRPPSADWSACRSPSTR